MVSLWYGMKSQLKIEIKMCGKLMKNEIFVKLLKTSSGKKHFLNLKKNSLAAAASGRLFNFGDNLSDIGTFVGHRDICRT